MYQSKLRKELFFRNLEKKISPYLWVVIGGLTLYTIQNALTLGSLPPTIINLAIK